MIGADMLTRYRILVWLAVLVALFAVAGCTTIRDMIDPDRTVAQRIRDADILVAASYQKITDDRRAGILTQTEALDRIATIDSIDAKIDTAKALLAGGDDQAAGKALDLANQLLLDYRKKLAEEARR